MVTLTITKWQDYKKEYIYFANLVDAVGKWIMLEVRLNAIIATGKPDAIHEFSELLKKENICFNISK